MRILLIAALYLCSACSTVRYSYEADIEIKKSEEYEYTFEKNYETTLDSVLCGLSFWFYGGWCWMYLGKPTSDDMDMVSRDAEKKIRQLMKRKELGKYDFEIMGSRIKRVSWGWDEKDAEVILSAKYSE